MVLSVVADVNEIAYLGKDFPWVKPSCCPCCGQPLWWHGFVLAYFSCLAEAVFLLRLRFSCCHRVHRLKPSGYWPWFRCAIADILASVSLRQDSGHWRREVWDRQRQWWQRLWRMTTAILGVFCVPASTAFEVLLRTKGFPVSRSFKRDHSGAGPPLYSSVSLP